MSTPRLKVGERCFPKLSSIYADGVLSDHSANGALALSYGESWLPSIGDIFIAAEQCGLPLNPDVNSGDPLGMGMGSVCIQRGQRLTAATAYLNGTPGNLTVLPNAAVAKVLFNNKRAIGVETTDGQAFAAHGCVVLAGGALNTPQTLMNSGIGPADELRKHGIPVISDLPQVGQQLQDHCFSCIGVVLRKTHDGGPESQCPSPMFVTLCL